MAGVVEEIFRIKSDTAQVLSQIQQLKGVFTELTEEQKKQVTQLAILEQKEKDLIKARNASTNPTTQIRINKELNENIKQLGFLKEAVDKFAKSETVARVEADALSKSVSNAFKQTQFAAGAKHIDSIGNSAANAATKFNPLNNSVNQLSRELPAFAVSANVGFLAISNNLPIFFDALQKINAENKDLAANGQKTTSVLSQLGSAVFSVGSLLSIGVTLLTIYGKEMVNWIATLFEGQKALESMKEANDEYAKSLNNLKESIADVTIKLKVQLGLISEVEGSILKNENARNQAFQKSREQKLKDIAALKEELGITDLLLQNYNKTITYYSNADKEMKTRTINSKAENDAITRYYNELSRINGQTKNRNAYINEYYNKLAKSIELEEEANKKAKKKNEHLEKEIDLSDRIRQLAIDDIKFERDREEQQAQFDNFKAARDVQSLNATAKQKEELTLALNQDLLNKLAAINDKYRKIEEEAQLDQVKRTFKARESIIIENDNYEIYLVEKKINDLEKKGDKADKDELKRLRKLLYDKKLLLLKDQEEQELAGLKRNENGAVNLAEKAEIENRYRIKRAKAEDEFNETQSNKNKKFTKEEKLRIIGYFEQIIQAAINATQQILALKIKEVDGQIEQQQRRVDEAKNIADRGNAELLELEQKRLDDLTKKKEKFVRNQQALAAVELIANTAIAVSKAAAQTGVAAGVGIAAALIALVAGLASARSIASQAAFYEGGYTGDGNPREESGAVGKRPYIYHKAEFVMDHKKTRQFRDIFEDIHGGKVDLKEWKQKVHLFDSLGGMQMFMNKAPYQANPQVNNIIQLKSLEGKFDDLNNTFKSLRLGLNVDENGFTTFMQKHISRDNHIKQMAKL